MGTATKKRRVYGEHFTPIRIFKEFILPEIKDDLYQYVWVDLFAGEGNLILPILELIPNNKRINFFRNHIFLFDVQDEFIEKSIENAIKYGIPPDIAVENIRHMDTIKTYPNFLLNLEFPIYHITNPPYLYIGYIAKNSGTQVYLEYFRGGNEGYQDLYQLGMINDLRKGIPKMIYIIPSNFLFGASVSNKIRDDFLKYNTIKKAIIFEKEIFEYTGTNVAICFFEKKDIPKNEIIFFEGTKINKLIQKRVYTLVPKNHYRAGSEFEKFLDENRSPKPLGINYYLTKMDVEKNKGNFEITVIDANNFNGKEYEKMLIHINKNLYDRIRSNILFIRTVDTGSINGRIGLFKIKDVYNVNGILVTKARYRTHPIQIFLTPPLSTEEQILLKNYFNLILEYFRKKTDSEFMTTYKYSNSEYTRKYLGLSQVKKLIQTFPILILKDNEKDYFNELIIDGNIKELFSFLKMKNGKKELNLWG